MQEKKSKTGVGIGEGCVCGRDLVSRIKNMTLFIRGQKIRGGEEGEGRRKSGREERTKRK